MSAYRASRPGSLTSRQVSVAGFVAEESGRNSRNANYGNYLSYDSDNASLIRLAADLISAVWPSALKSWRNLLSIMFTKIRALLIERNQSTSVKGRAYHATGFGCALRVDVKVGVQD